MKGDDTNRTHTDTYTHTHTMDVDVSGASVSDSEGCGNGPPSGHTSGPTKLKRSSSAPMINQLVNQPQACLVSAPTNASITRLVEVVY